MRNRICSRGRAILVFFCDRVLDRDGAFDGIDGAGEIGDDAVSGGIEDPAAMGGDQVDRGSPGRLAAVRHVPTSSSPISRLYSATSAAKIAASFRSTTWPSSTGPLSTVS